MSLVFAAIAPHPPILIPAIGKENLARIEKTEKAMIRLEQDLYASKPDVILIISPHGEIQADAFVINLSDEYEINFESFGDFATKIKVSGETVLIAANKEKIANRVPINIISNLKLDHGAGVPFFYLARQLENVRLLPISFSLLDNQTHLEFGKALKEAIMDSDKRVAAIASGDLSHCLNSSAPTSFNPAGKEFDEKLMDLLVNRDAQSLVNLDHKLVEEAAECGLRSILVLLGILNHINFQTEILSYEAPFGVGYLVAELKLE